MNPFLIFSKTYLTDDGKILKNRVLRGFTTFLSGVFLFFVMFGMYHSFERV